MELQAQGETPGGCWQSLVAIWGFLAPAAEGVQLIAAGPCCQRQTDLMAALPMGCPGHAGWRWGGREEYAAPRAGTGAGRQKD